MIAMLIFSAGIAIFFIMIQSMAVEYDNSNIIDENFNNSFNKFSNYTDKASAMYSNLTTGGGLKFADATELVFTGSFTVISLVFASVDIASSQLANFGSYFGIPKQLSDIFGVLIFTIIIVSLVFIIINSVRGGKEL